MPRAVPSQAKTQVKTLWGLVIGVSHYEDATLRSLPYAGLDAQGLATVLQQMASPFDKTVIQVHPVCEDQIPTRAIVQGSWIDLLQKVEAQDTILLYFAGHGLLDERQQAFLCLADTQVSDLPTTGWAIADLLTQMSHCKAATQVVILDACHSGRMTLRDSPMGNLLQQLQQTATHAQHRKQNFYGLLSCDADEESLEFQDLKHGLFTYYLIQGLQGEAINARGMIEIKNLYQYVYHQVLKYIDRRNQQIQLIYQQKRSRGEQEGFQKRLPLQNPKLIVEAIGDLVLSTTSVTIEGMQARRAFVLDNAIDGQASRDLGQLLTTLGGFNLTYWHPQVRRTIDLGQALQRHLQGKGSQLSLLYLRGNLELQPGGELLFRLNTPTHPSITVSWLRQQLRGNQHPQILILDAPQQDLLQAALRELEAEAIERLCLMVGSASDRETFLLAISQVLERVDRTVGLSAAEWIAGIQLQLAGSQIWRDFRLLGVQQVMEVVPRSLEASLRPVDFGICPYLGLRAFGEQDVAFFYGRTDLTQQLLQAIQTQPFIAVVGASGSGKSSVVQAGLVAQLRQGNLIPNSDLWGIYSLRPGAEPLQQLAQVMALAAGMGKAETPATTAIETRAAECEGLLHLGGQGFVRWLRQQLQPQIVLIIDQFEELFTLTASASRDCFLNLLLEALTHATDKLKLVITLRADFMAACLEYPTFAAQLQAATLYMPLRLTPEGYRQVIEAPAQAVQLQVEAGLVDILLQEIEQSTVDLPLLQFVLEQLWEWRDRTTGRLTLAAYRDQIGGLKGVLERRATE
ncbi:MAG: caspase family protein, partial [Synechococcales bacterium]|nr:caspase family protein [Synechococcales bacterium]